MRIFRAFLIKDFLRETRTAETLLGVSAFGLVIIVFLSLATPQGSGGNVGIAAGALWAALFFSSQVGLLRSIDAERSAGRLETILSTPIDATVFFLAKSFSTFLFILFAALILLCPFMVLFNIDPSAAARALPVIFFGIVGVSLTGTLVGFLAVGTKIREIIMPVLFLTLFIPLLLSLVAATTEALSGAAYGFAFNVIIGFDLLMGGTSILLVPSLLEE